MNVDERSEEIRERVIIAMLKEFPTLKERIKSYLDEQDPKRQNSN